MRPLIQFKNDWLQSPTLLTWLRESNWNLVLLVLTAILTIWYALHKFFFEERVRFRDGARIPQRLLCFLRGEFWVGHLQAFMELFSRQGRFKDAIVRIHIYGLPKKLSATYYLSKGAFATDICAIYSSSAPEDTVTSPQVSALQGFAALYSDRLPPSDFFFNLLHSLKHAESVAEFYGKLYANGKESHVKLAVSQYVEGRLEYWSSTGGIGSLEDSVTYFRKGLLSIFTRWFLEALGSSKVNEDVQTQVSNFVKLFMKISPLQLSRQALSMWNEPELGKIDEVYHSMENIFQKIYTGEDSELKLGALFLLLCWTDRVMPTWFSFTLFLVSTKNMADLTADQVEQTALQAYRDIHNAGPLAVTPFYIPRGADTFKYRTPDSDYTFKYSLKENSLLLWDRQKANLDEAHGVEPWLPEPHRELTLSIIKMLACQIIEKFDVGFELSSFFWVDQVRCTAENHALVYGLSTISDQLRMRRRVGYKKEALAMWYAARDR